MKSSLVSEQLSSWEVGVTAKGEVRNGLLIGCQSCHRVLQRWQC